MPSEPTSVWTHPPLSFPTIGFMDTLRSVANRRASVFRGSPWPTRLFGEIPTRCSDGMALTATQSKPRVLVVDRLDTVDTATVLLEFHGAQVDAACDGRTAIELACASCPGTAFVELV